MNNQLIYEIGTEEIPAGYLLPALENIKSSLARSLAENNLTFSQINGGITPRRIVVSVDDLIDQQPDRTEEVFGPPKAAAYDANNQPTKAAIGFAKSKGATLDDVQIITTDKGEYLMILQEQKGRKTSDILADLLPELTRTIPFPKSMRWGAHKTTFARPIKWLLAIYNNQTVDFTIDGAGTTGSITYGHRFMAPEAFEVKDYNEYVASLRSAHVLLIQDERKQAVVEEISQAAKDAGGQILADDELVDTVANLVEEPHAICGSFDPKFLELPKDALITSMREHQKYFAVISQDGALMPNFIAVNNTKVKSKVLGAEGHQRVLRARLEDGLFFFKEDQNRTLESRVDDLKGILFQAKLGTMKEKTCRIQALAEMIADSIAPEKLALVSRAALLSKADLLSEMVNEFPSLQGAMGRDYARLNGEPEEVALAIYEHYMPVRAGSQLPSTIVGAIVSIADRIDTIAGCFGIGQIPSGSADPFGLRRQALGLIHIIEEKLISLSLISLIGKAYDLYEDKLSEDKKTTLANSINFIKGRFTNNQTAQDIPPGAVEAVTSIVFDDIVDGKQRINALVEVSRQESFPLLAGSFKRVMNIIKEQRDGTVTQKLLSAEAEKELYAAYQEVSSKAQPLIDNKAYQEALSIILQMKEPIDNFFDKVMVMTDERDVRDNRLALLSSIAALFLQVGDFSKMSAVTA